MRIWWNGRHAGFRFQSERVQVQLLLSAPKSFQSEEKLKPTLYVLIGPPASGKSTYAQTMKNNNTSILSSDDIRVELFGDASVQTNGDLVFGILYERMRNLLKENKNVVIDATNINPEMRKYVFDNLHGIDANVVAIVFNTPKEKCYMFNKKRERHVPKRVIDLYFSRFIKPTLSEGFSEIKEINF